MFAVKRRTRFVAAAAIFSVIYAILGLFPVSAYIGVSSFLTFREVVSPLSGMLFGPVVGGFSMVLGNFVDFALGKPVVYDFLDFVPDLASAVMAGLVFTGRRKLAIAFPVLLVAWYSVDPLSLALVNAGYPIPFLWMHLVSVATLAAAFILEARGRLHRLSPAYVAATVFASTMTGHVAGSIMFENVVVRINGAISPSNMAALWQAVFYAYPLERALFTLLGTLLSVPVLRALDARGRNAR